MEQLLTYLLSIGLPPDQAAAFAQRLIPPRPQLGQASTDTERAQMSPQAPQQAPGGNFLASSQAMAAQRNVSAERKVSDYLAQKYKLDAPRADELATRMIRSVWLDKQHERKAGKSHMTNPAFHADITDALAPPSTGFHLDQAGSVDQRSGFTPDTYSQAARDEKTRQAEASWAY